MERCNEFSSSGSAIRVEENSIIVCRQCEDPECEKACKFGAISDKINEQKCTACGLCVSSCPYKAIFQEIKNAIPFKCNLCQGTPECVMICHNRALKFARKGKIPAFFRNLEYKLRKIRSHMVLHIKTSINMRLTMLGRSRIIRIREGKKDSFVNRLILTPMLKQFEKKFFSEENNN
jgi:Fe-S-cluster-containing hydrogenase component 2